MIIYIIIYHIRSNKNFNIDIGIKHNTIISTIISTIITTSPWQKKRKEKDSMIHSIRTSKYILNLSRQKKKKEKNL